MPQLMQRAAGTLMVTERPSEAEIEAMLVRLGIETMAQWDLLVFLVRHDSSLLGMEDLARLTGYPVESIITALEVLESRRLVERSRIAQTIRLYRVTPPVESHRSRALEQLLRLNGHRQGRALLSRNLQKDRH